MVYLDPAGTQPPGPWVEVGTDHLPDVVLEVDYSTDVRRGKLGLYEAWGFREVWVEVPEGGSPRRRPGLTIHRRVGDGYRAVAASVALPGWTAAEIHAALNEPALSEATCAVVERVGRALGDAAGTGPDDDLWLGARPRRAAGRGGRAAARAEGRARLFASFCAVTERLAARIAREGRTRGRGAGLSRRGGPAGPPGSEAAPGGSDRDRRRRTPSSVIFFVPSPSEFPERQPLQRTGRECTVRPTPGARPAPVLASSQSAHRYGVAIGHDALEVRECCRASARDGVVFGLSRGMQSLEGRAVRGSRPSPRRTGEQSWRFLSDGPS